MRDAEMDAIVDSIVQFMDGHELVAGTLEELVAGKGSRAINAALRRGFAVQINRHDDQRDGVTYVASIPAKKEKL